jgi:hypothetical protein
MKTKGIILFILLIASLPTEAQETQIMLDTFKRNFQKADKLETKANVLQDAINSNLQGMGPLYHLAIDYVINNNELLATDVFMRQIALLSAEQIKTLEYSEAKGSLWQLFTVLNDSSIMISILDALGVVGLGDSTIINGCINWLETQNNLFLSGTGRPDVQVVGEMVKALGSLKDPSAFSVLFSAYISGYSDTVSTLAKNSLYQLEGNFKDSLINVIKNGTIAEKREALIMGLESDEKLDEIEKAELAEFALEIAIYTSTNNQSELTFIRDMRYTALRALSESKWSRATALVIEHFGMTLLEYDRGLAQKIYLIEAIDGLGNMGTHEAAERLTLYLELINSYTEHGKVYDERIVLAVLNNLMKLGDKIAFADLSNTKYLNYNETIKLAAQDAIDNLKW